MSEGFVEEIKKSHFEDWERAKNRGDYASCMEELSDDDRQKLIESLVKHKQVNMAHLAIAALIKGGKIDRVVTTNFDSLLIRACNLAGVETAICDVDAISAGHFRVLGVNLPTLFYVHGQYHGYTQTNTRAEYSPEHRKGLGKLLGDIAENETLIVVGYSGENDPSVEAFFEPPKFKKELFWTCYGDRPTARIADGLLSPAKGVFAIPRCDADEFFVNLASEYGCDPLHIFRKPLTHLSGILQQVNLESTPTGFDVQKRSMDYIQRAIGPVEHSLAIEIDRTQDAAVISANALSSASGSWRKEEALFVPSSHQGLILPLSTFNGFRIYASAQEMASDVSNPEFRARAVQTNWGPMIVAIEHHLASLHHCWLLCSAQAAKDYDYAKQIVDSFGVACHIVNLDNANNILDVQRAVKRIYEIEIKHPDIGLLPSDMIADITSGLSTITGGIVLATLDEDRAIEYLTQGVRLFQNGTALTKEEIRERELLVGIRTSGEAVKYLFPPRA